MLNIKFQIAIFQKPFKIIWCGFRQSPPYWSALKYLVELKTLYLPFKIKPVLFDTPNLYTREIVRLLYWFFVYMRTSRKSGVYLVHEPDQPDMDDKLMFFFFLFFFRKQAMTCHANYLQSRQCQNLFSKKNSMSSAENYTQNAKR